MTVAALFVLDRDREAHPSKALWIPVLWILINASRPVSVWLGMAPTGEGTNVYVEGSPVDRVIYLALVVAGAIVLTGRKNRMGPVLRKQGTIVLFFAYCALSAVWAQDPLVTFKHWTKGVGDVIMVLIVATELQPLQAMKRLLARTAFLLIPTSLVLSKYYPDLGRFLTPGWVMEYTGVTQNKNQLGEICFIFGIGAIWCFLSAYEDRQNPRRKQRLVAQGVIIVIVAWLFSMANSMTSLSCIALGGAVLILAGRPAFRRKPSRVHLLLIGAVGLAVIALFFDPTGDLVRSLGRNPTLTGRTELWHWVVTLAGNPMVGVGYESFFMDPRLHELWRLDGGAFNTLQEAHNGYLEVYLNLGWTGVCLFAVLIVAAYRKVVAVFRENPGVGRAALGWFVTGVVYSLTEAGFRMTTPAWIFFLLAVIALPEAAKSGNRAALDSGVDEAYPEFTSGIDGERLGALQEY